MKEVKLKAEVRETGKSKARSLRREGKVPGIFYAPGEKNIPIAIREHDLYSLIRTKETQIINLDIGNGNNLKCILKDIEFDPVTDKPIHFDLYGLKEGVKITIEVPIVIKGHAVGVEKGGILEHLLHSVAIECPSTKIPDHIEVDITELDIGDAIHIKDLKVPDVRFLESEDAVVVSVVPPAVVEEEKEEAEEEAGKPEETEKQPPTEKTS